MCLCVSFRPSVRWAVQELVQQLPDAWAVVTLSRDPPLAGAGGDRGGGLTVSRLERDSVVRWVRVEAGEQGEDGEGAGGARAGGMQQILDEFKEIMKLSRAGYVPVPVCLCVCDQP